MSTFQMKASPLAMVSVSPIGRSDQALAQEVALVNGLDSPCALICVGPATHHGWIR